MKQYIDKSALIAEIEKRIKEIDEIGTYLSPKGVLTNLLCHLDTLEVKEANSNDAFIEKAWEWLRFNRWKYEDSREGNEAMEKDFRKTMKGE